MLYHNFYSIFSCYLPLRNLHLRYIYIFWTLSIVLYSDEHNVSETGSAYVLRKEVGTHLLYWVH
jgi:hypothetical protein